jgi:molecular chaperone DnaJ
MSDHYENLNVNKNSTLKEIKESYLKLIQIHHPDKQSIKDHDKFISIQESWEVLKNEKDRNIYDQNLLGIFSLIKMLNVNLKVIFLKILTLMK